MVRVLQSNTSLRSLLLTRSVMLPIPVTVPLLQALGKHQSLTEVKIENAKLQCQVDSHLNRLKETIVGMGSPPGKLRSLTLEPLALQIKNMSQ